MRKVFFIILLFVISTDITLSSCAEDSCNQKSQKTTKKPVTPDKGKIFSNNGNSFSVIKDIEQQIIASVNSQISLVNTDLSLAYRKKTLSLRYNMNNQLPEINSYFSIAYRKKAVSLNYTVAIW